MDRPASEFRLYWPVALGAAAGHGATTIHFYTLGAFVRPLEAAFGWSRTGISAASLVTAGVTILGAPFVGLAIDRYGARRVALLGLALYFPAICLLGLAGPGIWSWWLGFLQVGLGATVAGWIVWTAGVTRSFSKRAGLGLGLALCGGGVSSALAPSFASLLIAHFGWRVAYLGLGLGTALVAVPVVLFGFRLRDERLGRTGAPQVSARPSRATLDYSHLRRPEFWRLAVVALVVSCAVFGLSLHLLPLLVESGLGSASAAAVVGLGGAASVAGRLGSGLLLDRIHVRVLAPAMFGLPLLGCGLLLAGAPIQWTGPLMAVTLGLALGAEVDLLAYCTSRYFDRERYGRVFGLLAAMTALGSGLGPLAGGAIHDGLGSYGYVPAAAAACFVIGGMIFVTLGPYPARRDAG